MKFFGLTPSYVVFSVLHFALLVLALTVAALYGIDLQRQHDDGEQADSRWIYAEVVAGLSAITTLLYFIPFVLRFAFVPIWDAILFILWITLFGIFGKLFINIDASTPPLRRMRNAVWITLVAALLWLVGAIASALYWWRHRERRTRFTGRAEV